MSLATLRTERLEPALADREAVWGLVTDNAPYAHMMSLPGYEMDVGDLAAFPWYRAHWASGGRVLTSGTEGLFRAPELIDAARRVMGVEHVVPDRVVVNIMGPMGEGVPHVDLPTFRSADPLPVWLAMTMGGCGLFERWRVLSCGALVWFYDGPGGAYRYWPDGPTGPARSEGPPFGNVALVGDNDRMFHCVDRIGRTDDRLAPGSVPRSALLDWSDGWRLLDEGRVLMDLEGLMRTSLLWRALVFSTDRERQLWHDHTDDLTLEEVAAVFSKDLAERGIEHDPPADPAADEGWRDLLLEAYPPPTFAPG